MMPDCCIESFVGKGIEERFKLAKRGARHTCETCGRVYELMGDPKPTWTFIGPLHDDKTCKTVDNAPDCIKKGHTMIVPGYYVCSEGHTHIIGPEICRLLDIPPTRKNCERVIQHAAEWFGKKGDQIKITE